MNSNKIKSPRVTVTLTRAVWFEVACALGRAESEMESEGVEKSRLKDVRLAHRKITDIWTEAMKAKAATIEEVTTHV